MLNLLNEFAPLGVGLILGAVAAALTILVSGGVVDDSTNFE